MKYIDELKRILKKGSVNTLFQPIISLSNGDIIGYEALTRGPKESPLYYPEELFSTAQKLDFTSELELLCKIKTFENFSKQHITDKLLFINVDTNALQDEKFRKSFIKVFDDKSHNLLKRIVIEISERASIHNYKVFCKNLDLFINNGIKIALDDLGNGHNDLRTLTEIKPQYLKIDVSLTENVHKSSIKQALIESLVHFCKTSNIKLIAEGIETEMQLRTLTKLGVYGGQGYFIQLPSEKVINVNDKIIKIISENNPINKKFDINENYIGAIVTEEKAFYRENTCYDLKQYFTNSSTNGVCIIDNFDKPVGLVMQHTLNSMLATQYGYAVFTKRNVSLIMDENPLIVDYYTPVSEVSGRAMGRADNKLYDYVIVKKDEKYFGIVSIKTLLQFTTFLEKNYAKQLNPLSGLPGNTIIEGVLQGLLSYGRDFCVLYFDLDNFKVYNDTYGFENGDKILIFTANLIQESVKNFFPHNNFIGHIGGDDFVAVLEGSMKACISLCDDIINKFDNNVMNFFNENDRANGYIIGNDRNGNKDTFPLTSVSIAGLFGDFSNFLNAEEISKKITQIKKRAKQIHKSSHILELIE